MPSLRFPAPVLLVPVLLACGESWSWAVARGGTLGVDTQGEETGSPDSGSDTGAGTDSGNDTGSGTDTGDAGPDACHDGMDNDADGWTDAADPVCAAGPDEDDGLGGGALCNNGLDDDGDGWTDAQDTGCLTAGDDDEAMPAITITDPASGEAVPSSGFNLTVRVDDFTLDCDGVGGTNEPGHGHFHVFADGNYLTFSCASSVAIDGLAPGEHELRVELVNNDHSSLEVAEDAVEVTAI